MYWLNDYALAACEITLFSSKINVLYAPVAMILIGVMCVTGWATPTRRHLCIINERLQPKSDVLYSTKSYRKIIASGCDLFVWCIHSLPTYWAKTGWIYSCSTQKMTFKGLFTDPQPLTTVNATPIVAPESTHCDPQWRHQWRHSESPTDAGADVNRQTIKIRTCYLINNDGDG